MRSVFLVSLAFLAVHLGVAASIPLFDDEAYYALWARDLALGYYDHPPMIAYMIRLGTNLFGENAFAIRLIPVICFGAAGYFVGDIARMSGDKAVLPVLATTLYNLNLVVFALGSFATPDAPSTLFWVAALWAACRAVNLSAGNRYEMLWWGCTGLLIGFGGLSKFTNAFLALGLLAYLVTTVRGRAYLFTRLPYVAMAAAVLPLIPYLLWNLQNDWLGLQRQGARLIASSFSTRYVWEYAALLLLAPTPLVTWFAFRAVKTPARNGTLLVWSSVPLLLYFSYHATHAQIQANWVVPLQAAFAISAAFGLVQAQSPRLWIGTTIASACLLSFGSFAVAFNPFTPIGVANNPPNQTRGWSETVDAITELLEASGAEWIATTDYASTGALALRFPQVPVWSIEDLPRYGFRGTLPPELCTVPGLLIERARRSGRISDLAESHFETVHTTHAALRAQDGVLLMVYHLTPVSQVKSPDLCAN
ncbi:MAG: glycosyltransferase family 39 protein [Rhizobiaceae bacterium]|nr:glycosyltransferase family 39 protein [Rhizobiaceae bacterium]